MLSIRKLIRTITFGYLLFFARAFVNASSDREEKKEVKKIEAVANGAFSPDVLNDLVTGNPPDHLLTEFMEEESAYEQSGYGENIIISPRTKTLVAEVEKEFSKQGKSFLLTEEFKKNFEEDPDAFLSEIVEKDSVFLLKAMIEIGYTSLSYQYKNDLSLWADIIFFDAVKSVRLFIDNGISVNRQSSGMDGTPLGIAVAGPSLDTLRELLRAGADPNRPDIDKNTPLFVNIIHNDGEKAVDIARELIDAGVNIDVQPIAHGKTALYEAVVQGKRELVVFLLDSGANINLPNNNGLTPLHAAAMKGKRKIGALLLKRGANVHAKTKQGKIALDLAEERKDKAFAKMLKKHIDQMPSNLLENIVWSVSFVIGIFFTFKR